MVIDRVKFGAMTTHIQFTRVPRRFHINYPFRVCASFKSKKKGAWPDYSAWIVSLVRFSHSTLHFVASILTQSSNFPLQLTNID